LNDRGRDAEALAASYLQRQGLRIVERNWRCRFGEIDLIARDGASLVFVEVRARTYSQYGGAAESIDRRKRSRLIAAATQYLARAGLETPCRFDAVLMQAAEKPQWIRNAFSID
jgi:putative endonuclease